jgi:zinc D-Ala-D-Ala dipeptidase
MNRRGIYRLLEEKMLSYKDYADIPVEPMDEPLVRIPSSTNLAARQIDFDMQAYTGEWVFVRRAVLQKLKRASKLLAAQDDSMRLEIVYGYRALEIQKRLFDRYRNELESQYSGEELLAATHRLVAIPEVAGHPAGAAVDIQIIRNGNPLDFGTKIHEFAPDTFTFSPFIEKKAWSNRQLLRHVMIQSGFAPFDGEWWHFSYGDKEWAKYYGRQSAIYNQIHFTYE